VCYISLHCAPELVGKIQKYENTSITKNGYIRIISFSFDRDIVQISDFVLEQNPEKDVLYAIIKNRRNIDTTKYESIDKFEKHFDL